MGKGMMGQTDGDGPGMRGQMDGKGMMGPMMMMKPPILGRSVIIHAQADDLTTQPTGNAGARIGCGIIGIAKSETPATQPASN
jgi:Cu/Zn superoxide dismutase